jgi:hypothetical protein
MNLCRQPYTPPDSRVRATELPELASTGCSSCQYTIRGSVVLPPRFPHTVGLSRSGNASRIRLYAKGP